MAGPGNVDHVQVVLAYDTVQVHVDEILPGGGAPVPEQHPLDVRELQRLAQQRVIEQVELADRQIVGRAPVTVDPVQQLLAKRRFVHERRVLHCAAT
jgi:hypothetical protein